MFSIWITKDKSGYLIVNSKTTGKKGTFGKLEYERVKNLKAKTQQEATAEFAVWAKKQKAKAEAAARKTKLKKR